MNFGQKLALFILITLTVVYVYFALFNKEGFSVKLPKFNNEIFETPNITINDDEENHDEENNDKKEIKNVKIYILDSSGKIRSVNRKCETSLEQSCFEYAIKELLKAPTNWEKSKGFSSEIPANTKILSIRRGEGIQQIDLSSDFEMGGGTESIYTRVYQIIKTVNANTKLPVYLYINGKQADVIGGEGIMIKQPLSERSLDE